MLAIDGTNGDQPVNGAYETTWRSGPAPSRNNDRDEPGGQWLSINSRLRDAWRRQVHAPTLE